MMILSSVLLFSALLIAFFGLIVPDFQYTQRKWASRSWPMTVAVVEGGRVSRGGGGTLLFFLLSRAHMTYSYRVHDTKYTGWFVLISNDPKDSQQLIESLIGTRVVVKYDASRPEISLMSSSTLGGKKVVQDPLWA